MKVELQKVLPKEIEARSFELIEAELTMEHPADHKPIVKRVIHTTADFSFEQSLCFSKGVVKKTLEAIKQGGITFITDTNMGKAGINKKALERYGCKVECFIADQDVALASVNNQTTRAAAAVDKAAGRKEPCIFAVGNAPTALVRIYELIQEKKIKPVLVIGVPVGFVNVVESKELIMTAETPYIVAKGRKGGSNVAAAICNALLYSLDAPI